MKKWFFATGCFFLLLTSGFSQSTGNTLADDDHQGLRLNKFHLGLAGLKSTYQDTKYSDTQYNGLGGAFSWGLSRERASYQWNFGSTLLYSAEKGRFHEKGISNFNALFFFEYSRPLNKNFSLGGRWDIFDFNLKMIKGLGNNSSPTIYNSTLFAMGSYTRPLNSTIRLRFQLSIGLLALVKERVGFAFSAPQKILEQGVFDFQDEAQSNPLSLKYASVEPLSNFNKLYSSLQFEVKKRWVFHYSWTWVNYAKVKSYPLNYAMHQLGFRYNIQYKNK